MVDTVELVIDALAAGLPGVAVYGEELMEGHNPESVAALVVASRGGNAHSEIPELVEDRIQITAWAGKRKFPVAKATYGSARDVLHGLQNQGGMKSCLESGAGQNLADPDTGWAMTVGFFTVRAVSDPVSQPVIEALPAWGVRAATGSGASFTVDRALNPATCLVFRNGQKLVLDDDYSLSGDGLEITLTFALDAQDKLEVYG